jgi:AAA domain (dynein-related subfamily)
VVLHLDSDEAAAPVKDTAAHRLEGLVPNPAIAEGYVHRSFFGTADFELFDYAVEQVENIIMAGPTGSAKTTAARAYAASKGLPFVVVECNGAMDPGVVLGRTMIDPETRVPHWVDGDFTLVVRHGGVVILDEVNMAHPRVMAAFHQLLSVSRRISLPEAGETVLAAGCDCHDVPLVIFAAYNPRYEGTARLNYALANRFAIPLQWGYDRAVEAELVSSTRLLDIAESMRDLADIRTPVPTNALMELERHALGLGFELAAHLFVNRFQPEERSAVSRALEGNATAIAAEIFAAAE